MSLPRRASVRLAMDSPALLVVAGSAEEPACQQSISSRSAECVRQTSREANLKQEDQRCCLATLGCQVCRRVA